MAPGTTSPTTRSSLGTPAAGTILQLALYSDLLADAQGVPPAYFYVVTPGNPFITHPVSLWPITRPIFRLIRSRFLAHLERGHEIIVDTHYPEPVRALRGVPLVGTVRRQTAPG